MPAQIGRIERARAWHDVGDEPGAGPRRVGQVIVTQVAPGEDGIDEGKSRFRPVAHGHRDRSVELHHGR